MIQSSCGFFLWTMAYQPLYVVIQHLEFNFSVDFSVVVWSGFFKPVDPPKLMVVMGVIFEKINI
jgi:hypothetical protein